MTRILVVEDDTDLVELLSYNLKSSGFSVGVANDGVDALQKARSLVPDLILLDIMLPELDGFAVCEMLRRDPITGLGLASGDFADIARQLSALVDPGRQLWFLEGGYDLEGLATSVAATLSSMAGGDVRPEPPTAGGPGHEVVPAVVALRRKLEASGCEL